MNRYLRVSVSRGIVLTLLCLAVSACHIKLVSDYDDEFIRAATSTQKEISTLLQKLKNPPAGSDITYKGNIEGYNKIDVDLDGLLVLAMAHQGNDQTVAQVKKIIGMVKDLENLHKNSTLSANFLIQEQQHISAAFAFVIRTENDKKAGK